MWPCRFAMLAVVLALQPMIVATTGRGAPRSRSRVQAACLRSWKRHWTFDAALAASQYPSMRYTDRLADQAIAPSVGSRGDSYDNALAESVIGLFKTEIIHRRGPWRSLETVEFATLEWVDWFNTRRLLEPIGYVPPAEYEARYYEEQAAVA